MKEFEDLIVSMKAGYSFFYVRAKEINKGIKSMREALEKLNESLGRQAYTWAYWDFEKDQDPEAVIDLLDSDEAVPGTTMVAKNWHWFFKNDYGEVDRQMASKLMNRYELWVTQEVRRVLIIVGTDDFSDAIPKMFQYMFVSIELEGPGLPDLKRVYDYIVDSVKDNPKFKAPNKEDERTILNIGRGMTATEWEHSLSYSLAKSGGSIDPIILGERKAREVEKIAGVKFGRYPGVKLENLLGYDNFTNFALSTMSHPLAKGLIMLGPPGTGKTTFARALGVASKRVVFEMELAEMFGGEVGQSERLVREALRFAAENAPCVLLFDEIEKGLAGASGGTSSFSDGGTTKRSTSQILKFMSDGRPEGVYILATCNDISSIDPEWFRIGRWDSMPFFIDLPTKKERDLIWKFYLSKYNLKDERSKGIDDVDWTGAEIEGCCKIAVMRGLGIAEASNFVRPIAKSDSGKIQTIREWAKTRTIPASTKIEVPKSKKRALEL